MLIGFAGLGRMGRPMARNLARAGHEVVGFDPALTDHDKLDLGEVGISICSSADDIFKTEVSISMLPNDKITLDLAIPGVSQQAQTGHVHIIMGTVSPETIHQVEQAGAKRQIGVVDAPVTGSVSLASTAEINTLVGGSALSFAAVQPVLKDITRSQNHVGGTGAGATLKLAINAVLAVYNQAIAEGLSLAESNGVDVEKAYAAFENSVINTPYLGYKKSFFLDPSNEVAMPMDLLLKDVSLALSVADNVKLLGVETARDTLQNAVDKNMGHLDMAQAGMQRSYSAVDYA